MDNNLDTILFLGHQQVSHAYDTFFDGCVNVFKAQNIFEYPILEKYHYNSTFDSNIQHTDIQPVYGWWCKNNIPNNVELSLLELSNKINNLEIKYIIGSNRAIENFIQLLLLINDNILSKICIVFLEEEEDKGFEIHRKCIEQLKEVYYKIDIHYKVDFILNKICHYSKIYPFYMSCPEKKILSEVNNTIKSFEDREIDICYLTESNHPDRIEYYNLIRNIKGNNLIICGKHNFSLKQYFNNINNSKIFISVRGNGWSNTRNIEGPALGAALFVDKLEITIPFNYEDKKSAVFFDKNTLVEKLNEYLEDKEKLQMLSKYSYEHCIDNHTTTARAKQMVELAKKIKGW